MLMLPLSLSLAPSAAAQTDGVQVTPVVIHLESDRGLSSVRLRNRRDREVAFEVSIFLWEQRDGEDIRSPTTDIIVAPSVFVVRPNAEQIVRLAIASSARGPAPEQEIAYRLLMRELPVVGEEPSGFHVQLQMSLPVFIPPRPPRAEIAARRVIDSDAGPSVVLENTGSAHIRLASVTYGPSDQSVERLPRYLLAGASITRPLPRDTQTVDVVYATSGANAPISETLTLDAPTPALRVR